MSTKVEEWTVLSMLEWATDFFEKKNIPDPRLSIEWLLAETLDIKRLDLYLKYDRPLSAGELKTLRPLVKRRARHEPLQYIIGFSEFMNARISVDERVLIPRIETEQLVEIILDEHPPGDELSVLDIGTGSGCIAIALKMERPEWKLSGIDISKESLKLAQQNADLNKVEVTFTKCDILSPVSFTPDPPFDIIVSNPPYVTPSEKNLLEPQVKDYEPAEALFVDNIENMYGSIIRYADQNLSQKGSLYLEVHEHYSREILSLFDHNLWSAKIVEDYDKKSRFIVAHHS